jgi:hypothetical protein
MTIDEEKAFLEQFIDLADAGQLVTIHTIMEKYVQATGKACSDTTIYRLLKRHGWRKVTPRPEHPGKASDEEIETSKKLTKRTVSYWKNLPEADETNTSATRV